MSKRRKTRQQKLLADQRHVLYHLETTSAQAVVPTEKKIEFEPKLITHSPQTTTYAYVLTDIKKTALITSSILIVQIVLFILMKRI